MATQDIASDVDSNSSDGSFIDLPSPSAQEQPLPDATQQPKRTHSQKFNADRGLEETFIRPADNTFRSKVMRDGKDHSVAKMTGNQSTLSPSSSVTDEDSNIDLGENGIDDDRYRGQQAHPPSRKTKETISLPDPIFVLLPDTTTSDQIQQSPRPAKQSLEKGQKSKLSSKLDTQETASQKIELRNN